MSQAGADDTNWRGTSEGDKLKEAVTTIGMASTREQPMNLDSRRSRAGTGTSVARPAIWAVAPSTGRPPKAM